MTSRADVTTDDVLAACAHFAERLAELPDPESEPIPRRREELLEDRRLLDGKRCALAGAANRLGNLERRAAGFVVQRDALLDAVASLEAEAAEKRGELAKVELKDRTGRWQALANEIAEIDGAAQAGLRGWWQPGAASIPPRRLALALPVRLDLTTLRPLRYLVEILAELDLKRARVIDRIRSLLDGHEAATAAESTGDRAA